MAPTKSGRRGLGRGLSALMADVAPAPAEGGIERREGGSERMVPIENIHPNPHQPRRSFKPSDMQELAASIREKGVLQPLIVRKHPQKTNSYEIVAGERRWRAAQNVQVHELPVIVRDYDDNEVLEIAIIENVQRADLNPIEEATGYRQLMDRFGHTQEKLAAALSKSRSHIANLMRLLTLPDDVLDMLRDGQISAGHARALIPCENASQLARRVVAQGLSVRETERLAKGIVQPKTKNPAKNQTKDADTRALELDLSANIKMAVTIDQKPGAETGQVVIRYKTMDELDEICRMLSSGPKP